MESFSMQTILDNDIEDARTKKKTVDKKMDLVLTLMREVELKEKAAEKAKQEVNNCTLEILAEIDELTLAQQYVKEKNIKRAAEVYAKKADLATEMKELQYRVSSVLDEGNGCLATIYEMYATLEKRLTLAVKQKEAADKEKLQKEEALAYQKSQMERLVEQSKILEQQVMENLKVQEFLRDRRHVVNMLEEDISCKCEDVNLLKHELEVFEVQSEISLTKDCLRPIEKETISKQDCETIPKQDCKTISKQDCETISKQDCECYKCNSMFKGAQGITTISTDGMRTNKIVKPLMIDSDFLQELVDSCKDHQDKDKPKLAQVKKWENDPKKLEEEAMDNLKVLQEFLKVEKIDEKSCGQDVNVQKEELADYKDEDRMSVTEDNAKPIIQETITGQDCECYKCPKGVWREGRVVAKREGMRTTNKIVETRINDSEMIQELADSYMENFDNIISKKLDNSKRRKKK